MNSFLRLGRFLISGLLIASATAFSGCVTGIQKKEYDSEIVRAEKGEWGSMSHVIADAKGRGQKEVETKLIELKTEALSELDNLRIRADAVKIVFLRSLLAPEVDRKKVAYLEGELEGLYRKKLDLIEALAEEMKRTRGLIQDDFRNFNGVFLRLNM